MSGYPWTSLVYSSTGRYYSALIRRRFIRFCQLALYLFLLTRFNGVNRQKYLFSLTRFVVEEKTALGVDHRWKNRWFSGKSGQTGENGGMTRGCCSSMSSISRPQVFSTQILSFGSTLCFYVHSISDFVFQTSPSYAVFPLGVPGTCVFFYYV